MIDEDYNVDDITLTASALRGSVPHPEWLERASMMLTHYAKMFNEKTVRDYLLPEKGHE